MSYQAIYRRFRPKTFDDVLGQEHITKTLKNQILNDNVAHAYLFSGTRGTGKTSTAKIFARAVNCLNNTDGNPCNECNICRGILDNSIMDVIEMDAASNNSVEDIRELREKVKYLPSKGRFKVYIIDEVHMLSKGAFNALLKTLEEPPKHLLFILATTEPQKIPATILSRCQRFDFNRISTDKIVENMRKICDELNAKIDDRSLNLIARNSDGAMRDALSILDQCVSFAEGEINYEYVVSILGIVNNELIFELSEDIIGKNLDKVLEHLDEIVKKGKDINQFIKDLILHFRNLMIAKSTDNLKNIIDAPEDIIDKLKEQSDKIDLDEIIRYLNILSEAEVQSKRSSQPRIILEINIIKLLTPSIEESLEGLTQRIKQIEKQLKQGSIKIESKEIPKKMEQNSSNKVKQEETKSQQQPQPQKEESPKAVVNIVNPETNEIEFEGILKEWPNIFKNIKSGRISIGALLVEGKPTSLEGKTLHISFKEGYGFHKDAIDRPENREYIEKNINEHLGTDLRIKCVMADDTEKKNNKKRNLDDAIKRVKEIFGEDIVEVEEN